MGSLLSIGITGMTAAQYGLLTAEHNISNATTPGYNRQRTVQATNIPFATGAGFIGQGTHVSTVERLYNQHLVTQINRAQASVSELDVYYSQITQIDNMLADASAGVSPALQDFFRGVQQVAANPALLPSRQAMVSSAEALGARYKSVEARLSELAEGVNVQIESTVSSVNSYAQQIAEINQQIILAQSSTDQPANDLLDQRDRLVAELNQLVQVTVTTDRNNSYNVFFGTGQQLVVGPQHNTLAATPSSIDGSRTVVGLVTAGGIQEMPDSLVTGGTLGGLLRFRTEALDRAANDLGLNAVSLALTFNAQHALGQDLLGQVAGNAGFTGDLFTFSQPKVIGGSGSAATITASFIEPPPFNGTNFYTDLTGHDYRVDFVAANQFTVTDLATNKIVVPATVAPAAGLAFDGLTINVSAGGVAGDRFVLQPTREVARNIAVEQAIAADVRLIAAAAPVRTLAPAANSGNAEISAGSVATGYSLANLPASPLVRSLTYSGPAAGFPNGALSGFPVGTTVTVTINGASTPYPIAAATDLVPYTSGATITVDGISFTISGTPSAGDQFNLGRNGAGTADSRNALALGQLQVQTTMAGGKSTYQSAYAQLVSDVGNKTRTAQVIGDSQRTLLEQSKAARESVSGVNLDEEAANLIQYQQAYQASAKMIEMGSKLFDILLAIRS